MSPIAAPHTITISCPASSPTPFTPAGLISRDEPIAKRSPATTKFSPRATRSLKSGIRKRNEPAFHRASSVSRVSETQSFDGVIWSVSIASSFFPGTLGSQKMSAFPRMTVDGRVATWAPSLRAAAAVDTPGRRRAGAITLTFPWSHGAARRGAVRRIAASCSNDPVVAMRGSPGGAVAHRDVD